MASFTYEGTEFLLDGKPVQILSGSIHYFRTVPEYWRDRLRKLRQCGFNTVETYTCWNLHERREGVFDFSGMLDLARFIDIAKEEGLLCIIRPGPYICAEWDFGGLPSWLLKYRSMRIRCLDKDFFEKETRYLDKIFDIVRPRLITNGGNVIMLQVENEYGAFGNDHGYIKALAEHYRKSGIDVMLFTSDGPSNLFFGGGSDPDLLMTANFGSSYEENLNFLKNYRSGQPVMCAEFWEGWFDWWGEPHNRRDPDDVAEELDGMLSSGASVNFYMFCGGTNFGFYNGANDFGHYHPTVTSYDYDAALSECGDLTKRYFEVRKVAEKYFGKLPELTVKDLPKKAYGKVKLTSSAGLLDNIQKISSPVKSAYPLTMEELDVDFGFVLYSTVVDYPVDAPLIIEPLRDSAYIFINGVFAGIKERDGRNDEIDIHCEKGKKCRIDVLVENRGRVNYGVRLASEQKGLVEPARLGQQNLFGWTMFPLLMEDLIGLEYSSACTKKIECPAFLRGELAVEGDPCDTFLRLAGFDNGFVKVNGFNIGRYRGIGPQKTLYVPAPLLHTGANEITVFELTGFDVPEVEFTDRPDLG